MIEHAQDGALTFVEDILTAAPVVAGRVKPSSVLKIGETSVIVFAFDTGTELREHHAPVAVLLQVLDGQVKVTAAGQTIDMRMGGLLHIAADVPHSVVATEPSRLQLTILGTGHP